MYRVLVIHETATVLYMKRTNEMFLKDCALRRLRQKKGAQAHQGMIDR